ncbi:Rieske (2Fe-2S) protein [Stakelama tenebrarum]|uniref:Non-heme iron oxygenase ferredoxin subunit n=1 Tax=Stakelama tenebrarum TaxID=2711215 RepID=A0A6G6Y876_9SPHN|nr:non-heme iron oxygenase ferredoxin subunit [Sphingosinithalassobacter tenebrarum]QIG80776.1 non-heme iron oxygenase ferredoxin subunit [Sphingosinithalassobacter tenebrarum]
MTEPAYTRALPASELEPNSKKPVEINGKSILLCHTNGTIHAVSNICSHADEKLECGLMRRGWISCPVHGARFDLATGKAMNPPAKQPIAVYPVRVVDDWIEVEA